MKTKIYSILFLVPVLLVAACNKKLDIAPENTLVDKDVFKTEGGAEQALSEAYYTLFGAATSGIAYVFGDFTTPILNHSVTYDVYDLGQATPTDYNVVGEWTNYYNAINVANNVIDKIPAYGKFDAKKEAQFIAEAKFVRSFAYLELLKLYGDGALTEKMDGQGVPLQLTPFQGYNTGQIIPRSTNGEVYASIIKDLTDIISDLPDKQADETKTRSRATVGGANALLARTYLYMHKYDEAAAAAKKVLDKQDVYSITGNLLQVFPANPNGTSQSFTSEYILGFPISFMISSSTYANNNIATGYYFKRAFWISSSFISEFEPGDLRVSQLMFKGDQIYNVDRLNDYTTFKFNNSNGRDNVAVIRLPEIMLIRAEALARTQGVNNEAISLLNTVRNRSLPNAVAYTTGDFADANALVEKILTQRKFELAFEGFYRYDLIRTGKPLHSPDLPENNKVLPIPQVEVDISKGLIKQNAGYAF